MFIALAAAAALLPVPEGRGGFPVPLAFVSDPPGAVASVRFRDRAGALVSAECVTPCTLMIAQASPLRLSVAHEGRPMVGATPKWCGVLTRKFCLGVVKARLP